jgi:signal transduction histidine kinase
MSLAEIEQQVLALPEDERRQFAAWFYQNEGKILPPHMNDEIEDDSISDEVMEELVRRRGELEESGGTTFTIEEMSSRVRKALDEVHRSSH